MGEGGYILNDVPESNGKIQIINKLATTGFYDSNEQSYRLSLTES
jgi:hypothetical protein